MNLFDDSQQAAASPVKERPTEPQKWQASPDDPPGPRQVKSVNKAIGHLHWQGKTYTEITGIHGQPETESCCFLS